jgi:hypothetical protein
MTLLRSPLMLAGTLYLGVVGVMLAMVLAHTGGTFIYAQDDPYIHLAIARTLAEHGVWGIRPQEFASASSSPLWTLVLAGFWKAGLHVVWLPIVLNVMCGVALLAFVDRLLAGSLGARERGLFLTALVFATPLPTLALIGMEHSLQILLTLLVAWRVAGLAIGADRNPLRRPPRCCGGVRSSRVGRTPPHGAPDRWVGAAAADSCRRLLL